MNNVAFGKTMANVRHRDIKLVTRERRRNYFVSEPNYYTTKFFIEDLLAIEMKQTNKQTNKKNRSTYEETCVFRTFNTRIK